MERRARFRTGVFVAVILVIMALFTFRLYALQTSLTEEEMNSLRVLDKGRGTHDPDAPGVGEMLLKNYKVHD